MTNTLPFVTDSALKINGIFQKSFDSFIVEEIPLYTFSGSGQHLICKVTKRGLNTQEVIKLVQERFNISIKDIGVAGQKDKIGTTTQYLSLSVGARFKLESAKEILEKLSSADLKIEIIGFHNNKIKTGHLLGNNFQIEITNVAPEEEENILKLIKQIEMLGIPNFYGQQRFGVENKNADRGKEILSNEKSTNDQWQKKFFSNAYQSSLFNQWLAQRINDGLYRQIIEGDIIFNVGKSRPLPMELLANAQQEFDEQKIVYTGPIYGPQMATSTGEAYKREMDILKNEGIELSLFNTKNSTGTRREAIIYPDFKKINFQDQKLQLLFSLPPGVYATVVLRELLKMSL